MLNPMTIEEQMRITSRPLRHVIYNSNTPARVAPYLCLYMSSRALSRYLSIGILSRAIKRKPIILLLRELRS